MDELIHTHAAIMDKYDPEKKIALVVDEWGAWLARTPARTKDSSSSRTVMRDAIIAALNINIVRAPRRPRARWPISRRW